MDPTAQADSISARLEKIERHFIDRIETIEKSLRSEIYDASERTRDRIRDLQGLMDSRLDELERGLERISDRPIQMTGDLEDMQSFFSDTTDSIAEMQESIDEIKTGLKGLAKAVAQLH